MKKCPVCGVMMGDNVARCSMCKYDFQKASQGDAEQVMAEAKRVMDQKEEENLARTEAKRSEEEKHLAEIREKINREINTLTAKFESEKLRLDSEYAAMQKQAIDEKLRLEDELNVTRSEVEAERQKIVDARAEGERIKQSRIDEGQAKYEEMVALAEKEQQRILEDAGRQTEELAIQLEREYGEAIAKRDQVIAEAQELQTYLDNADAIKAAKQEEITLKEKELSDIQREIEVKAQVITDSEAQITKLQSDYEVEKARLENEAKAIAEAQAGEALRLKAEIEAEKEQIERERDIIIADIEQRRTDAQAELDGLVAQAKDVIAEAEEAGYRRDELLKAAEEAQSVAEASIKEAELVANQKAELEKQIADEKAQMEAEKSNFTQQIADYENQIAEYGKQIEAISDEYNQAQAIIADSKTATVQAQAVAEEIILDAEKRAVFLKEVSLSESEKGSMQKQIDEKIKEIEEKEQQIREMEKQRDELAAKIQNLESSIAALEKKAKEGAFTAAESGPKEYAVDVVPHNNSSEVDVDGINSVLIKRSAEGWKLTSVINDEGGKLQSSLGGNDGGGSLSVGAFSSKEDRVVLIFERSKQA